MPIEPTFIQYDPDQSYLAPSGNEIRLAIEALVREACSNVERAISGEPDASLKARTHSRWMLRFELGEVVEILRSDAEEGRVPHAWMISIAAERPFNDAGSLIIPCDVNVWGFIEHSLGELREGLTSEDLLDLERREIERLVFLNQSFLGLQHHPKRSGIAGVSMIQFEDIDVVSFGDVHTNAAQGAMSVRLREQFIKTV